MKSTSPTSGKRACLCKNGKYSRKCCKGETINQGIGTLDNQGDSLIMRQQSVRTTTRVAENGTGS